MRITVTTQKDIAYLQKYLHQIGESLQIGSTIEIGIDESIMRSPREPVLEQVQIFREICALFSGNTRASIAQKFGVARATLHSYCSGAMRLSPKTLDRIRRCPELQNQDALMARLEKCVWRGPGNALQYHVTEENRMRSG